MVKVILEQADIEKLIKDKYKDADIIGDVLKDIEVVIQITEFVTTNNSQPTKDVVKTDNGSIDAKASGLTESNRRVTKPGQAMGRERGRMPTF